jgi:hypothetical protein
MRSRDIEAVCRIENEFWNGQEIVRVMESGPIREFTILVREENGRTEQHLFRLPQRVEQGVI